MFITRLIADQWNGSENIERSIELPTLKQVQDAIVALDAKTRTLVMLQKLDGPNMGIGGGDGKYIVYLTFDDIEFFNLINPGKSEAKVLITAGGQAGDYAEKQVVNGQLALEAAKVFAEKGQLAQNLNWEKQD